MTTIPENGKPPLLEGDAAREHARRTWGLSRDEIIAKLVKAFGPNMAWSPRRRGFVADGRDEARDAMITFKASDGFPATRALTFGEIADALVAATEEGPPAGTSS